MQGHPVPFPRVPATGSEGGAGRSGLGRGRQSRRVGGPPRLFTLLVVDGFPEQLRPVANLGLQGTDTVEKRREVGDPPWP